MQVNSSIPQQSTYDSSVPQIPIPQKNNANTWLIVIITVLLTGLITGTSVYFWQKSVNEQNISELKQPNIQENLPIIIDEETSALPTDQTEPTKSAPALATDQTKTWLTYKNSNVAYSFKYPLDASLKEENMIQVSLWGPTQKQNTEFYDGINLNFSLPFQIGDMSLSDYVDQEIEQSKENAEILKEKTNVNIGGMDGYYYTAQGLGIFDYIYLQSPDKKWVVKIFNGTNDPTNQGYDEIADQILSTFEFLN